MLHRRRGENCAQVAFAFAASVRAGKRLGLAGCRWPTGRAKKEILGVR